MRFLKKALLINGILVLGDIHLGYEEGLRQSGAGVKLNQFDETIKDLQNVLDDAGKIKEIVILGDLKHEFSGSSWQGQREINKFIEYLREKSRKITIVKGNHDTLIEGIAKKNLANVEVFDYYTKGEICFMHGHKIFPECTSNKIKKLVLGHRHPAVVLADKYKKERYKCFLVGKWKGKDVFVLPSFFPFVEGSEISIEEGKFIIPESKLRDFEAYVIGDRVYRFGKVKNLI